MAAQAGHLKYHICIVAPTDEAAGCFLYINSKSGYDGDLVLPDGEIPSLPRSKTGETVISCSQLVRVAKRQLRLFECRCCGALPPAVARKLEEFCRTVPTLTPTDRKTVMDAMAALT